MTCRSFRDGFTLVELLVTIGILSLMLAASWGRIGSLIHQHRLTGAATTLATHLRLARERAVTEGNNYVVTFLPSGDGYEIWDDEGNDDLDGPADSRTTHSFAPGTALSAARFFASNRVIFHADGSANASGWARITNGENSRSITVLASTGKVTITAP
jgi:type IV fimbrial biogenesis protein FimT